MTEIVAAPRRRPFHLMVGALFAVEVALILTALQSGQSSRVLTWAFVVDLIVGPVVVYGICRGWRRIVRPGFELFEALAVALIILRFVVPPQLRLPEAWLEAPWLLVEVALFVLVVSRFRAIRATYRLARIEGRDAHQSLYVAFEKVLGRGIAGVMCLEVWSWMTLVNYRALRNAAGMGERFTYFKRSGVTTIYPALGLLIIIEIIIVHALLFALVPPDWQFVVWIVTLIGAYPLVLICSSYAAMLARPHLVKGDSLELWAGLGGWIDVPFQHIETITKWAPGTGIDVAPSKGGQHQISPVGAKANVCIDLQTDVQINGPSGMRNKSAKCILLFVDEPDRFIEVVSSRRREPS